MADFKSAARKTSVPGRNPVLMVDTARAVTNEEIEAAAAYFSGLTPRPAIKIDDFRGGVREGTGSALMKPVVEKLSMDDMISLAAYAASLIP
jgi:cytochrome c553